MSQEGEQTQAEYYTLIRHQIGHHDQLIHQRVTWQILRQAFFFGAYAAVLNAPKEAKTPLFDVEQHVLLWLLPTAGLWAGALTYASIVASLKNIEYLRSLYDEFSCTRPDDTSSKLFPSIQGPPHFIKWAKLPLIWMPMVFTAAWLIILVALIAA